jgi:glycosyltransferase involved in cell wall biosynthesis
LKILYDITYATRGKSGIPRDAKLTGEILTSIPNIQCDLVLSPKSYVSRRKIGRSKSIWLSAEINSALNLVPGRAILPRSISALQNIFSSLSIKRKIKIQSLNELQRSNALLNLFGSAGKEVIPIDTGVYIYPISLHARFLRPRILKSFKIGANEYNFFVQQQCDPIEVSKKTIHIVRIHDILPLTHPQFFDSLSVQNFSASLRKSISGYSKVWVFDSPSSAQEFRQIFGMRDNVFYIPCPVLDHVTKYALNSLKKINQILMVNTIEPRKNVEFVIQGFRRAKDLKLVSSDWKLKIVGASGWLSEKLVDDLESGAYGTDIEYLGSVSDYVLYKSYQESKLLVSATFAEGFGLPPLEGMLSGCVPLVSDIAQHRESIGEFGTYFDPENQNDFLLAFQNAVLRTKNGYSTLRPLMRKYVLETYSLSKIRSYWSDLLEHLREVPVANADLRRGS